MEMDVRFQLGNTRFNYRCAGILMKSGHVLFHRQREDSYWSLPGGGIEIGEDSSTSIIREWKEELGYDVMVDHLAFVSENFFQYKGTPFHELGFYHVLHSEVKVRSDPFHGLEGERLVYQWLPLDKLDDYDLRPHFLIEKLSNLPETTEHIVTRT